MALEWISRAEAGRRLGVSAMAVTKFCRKGMPHRFSDGKVCWPDALYWSDWYRCPWSSGNWFARHPHPDFAKDRMEAAARALRRAEALAWVRARKAGMDTASVANRAVRRGATPCVIRSEGV